MWYFLSIIAMVLFLVLFVVNFFFSLVYDVKDRKWFRLTTKRNKRKAVLIDVFGNYIFSDFWNFAFSKSGYKFGVFGETLSSCFGKKRLEKSLTIFGLIISYIIDFIDFGKWYKGGHCIASIMTEEQINNMFN